MLELHRLAMELFDNVNHLQYLFDLLNLLESEHGYRSQLCNENEVPIVDVIYLLQDHIEYCFNENGKQIAPVSMLFESENVLSLVDLINKTGLFCAEVKEFNKTKKQAHILLHPKDTSPDEVAA